MEFKPETSKIDNVPFYEDVTSVQGWEGHTTGKSIDKLQQEIAANLALIGCVFTACHAGKFGDRYGYQIHFAMKTKNGQLVPSRMDIACLPINPRRRYQSRRGNKDPRIEGTQKMALYMVAKAIKGMYFMSVLSPDFVPFLSLMLDGKNQTLGSVWIQSGSLAPMLPPPKPFEDDIVNGEVV